MRKIHEFPMICAVYRQNLPKMVNNRKFCRHFSALETSTSRRFQKLSFGRALVQENSIDHFVCFYTKIIFHFFLHDILVTRASVCGKSIIFLCFLTKNQVHHSEKMIPFSKKKIFIKKQKKWSIEFS